MIRCVNRMYVDYGDQGAGANWVDAFDYSVDKVTGPDVSVEDIGNGYIIKKSSAILRLDYCEASQLIHCMWFLAKRQAMRRTSSLMGDFIRSYARVRIYIKGA